jgi:hypothetical protein
MAHSGGGGMAHSMVHGIAAVVAWRSGGSVAHSMVHGIAAVVAWRMA